MANKNKMKILKDNIAIANMEGKMAKPVEFLTSQIKLKLNAVKLIKKIREETM